MVRIPRPILSLFTAFLVIGFARSATPESDLLRLTPDDSTFCLVIRDMRGQFARISDGPIIRTLRGSKLGQALASAPEFAQVDQALKQITTVLQADWSQIRDDILGDAVVLSFQAAGNKNAEDRGLLLTWARDQKLAARLLDRANAVQKESGELKEIRPIAYGGETYFERVKARGEPEFYLFKGPILAFSSQESAIRSMIDRSKSLPAKGSRLHERMTTAAGQGDLVTLWVNPRSFDSEMALKAKNAAANEAPFLAMFSRTWHAIDDVLVGLRVDKHVELALSINCTPEKLPPALARLLRTMDRPSAVWSVVPEDAIFAAAGRIDLPSLKDLLGECMSPDARKGIESAISQNLAPIFGKNIVPLLPSHVGPDWGVCVTPPRGRDAVFPEVLAAVRVQPGERGRMQASVRDALESGFALLRVHLNTKSDDPVRIETRGVNAESIRYLTHDQLFPAGVQPAFAFKNGFLMLATHPDRIAVATIREPEATSSPHRLAMISFRHLHQYLSTSRNGLADFFAAQQATPKAEVLAQIDKVLLVLEPFDRIELLNGSQSTGEMKLVLRLGLK